MFCFLRTLQRRTKKMIELLVRTKTLIFGRVVLVLNIQLEQLGPWMRLQELE